MKRIKLGHFINKADPFIHNMGNSTCACSIFIMPRMHLVNSKLHIHNLLHHVPSALGTESSCNQLEKDQGREVHGDADDNEQFSSGNFYGSCLESG